MMIDHGLELLDEPQCLALLAGATVGRVGTTIGGLPVILPVNYKLVGGDVFFRTNEGTKLDAATRNAIVAFEVDECDQAAKTGWSVLVIGRAERVPEHELHPAIPALLPDLGSYVRIATDMLSGRRIALV
jgi:nitroimidazol reductase NimA-like FMN-containing flavoprotein (pyridoxamine 5'-phosphate oxidase superfamily)